MTDETGSEVCEVVPEVIELPEDTAIVKMSQDIFTFQSPDGKHHSVEGDDLSRLAYAFKNKATVPCRTNDGTSIKVNGKRRTIVNHRFTASFNENERFLFCECVPAPKRLSLRGKSKNPGRSSAQGVRQSNARF